MEFAFISVVPISGRRRITEPLCTPCQPHRPALLVSRLSRSTCLMKFGQEELEKSKKIQFWKLPAASALLTVVLFSSNLLPLPGILSQTQTALSLTEEQKLVAEAWRVVDQGYVDRTFNNQDWFKIRMKNIKKQFNGMEDAYETIRTMLSSLNDPYTRFLTPAQYNSLTSSATGELAGVGVELYPALDDKGRLVVLSPIDDSPALRAGLRAEDIVTEIDGESTEGLNPDEAAARIRGNPGTSVSLTVIHADNPGKEVRLDLKRQSLKIQSVKHEIVKEKDGSLVGVLKIKQFNSSTADDAQKALGILRSQGARKYVIDLRNNPGGYFPAGVDVARLFLDKNKTIVYVVNNKGIPDEYQVLDEPSVKDPVVVLVNRGTASASEILSGALKDNHRAVLIGEKTFGKGVVQSVSGLSDGSAVAVTVARYETPGHIDINKKGIEPDVSNVCPVTAAIVDCLPAGF